MFLIDQHSLSLKKDKMSIIYRNLILITLTLLIGTEILSIVYPIIGRFGTLIWIFAFFLLLFEAFYAFYKIVKKSILKKTFLTLIVLLFFVTTAFLGVNNLENSNFETTLEISCAINNFSSIDFGFRNTCLYGYPDRQLFIPALPSLLFGRNFIALNIGGALYFISGLIIYSWGILNFFKNSKYSDAICAILISSLFNFYYINRFSFANEQSIFPISFAMMALGMLLSLTNHNFYKNIGLIGILIAYLTFAYTTGLFFSFFVIAILFYLFFSFAKTKNQKIFISFVIFAGFLFFISSLLFRQDLHLVKNNPNVNVIANLYYGFTHLIVRGFNTNYVSEIFQLFFLIGLFAPFLLRQRKYYLFIFAWIIGVFTLSIVSKGYAYYPIDFRVHRGIVAIPVILICLGLVLESIRIPFVKKSLFYNALLVTLFTSAVAYQNNFIKSHINMESQRHTSFNLWLKDKLKASSLPLEGNLIFDDELRNINNVNNYTAVQNITRYYLPKINVCSISSCPEQNLGINYYVKPYSYIKNQKGEVLGIFDFNGDKIEVFKGNNL